MPRRPGYGRPVRPTRTRKPAADGKNWAGNDPASVEATAKECAGKDAPRALAEAEVAHAAAQEHQRFILESIERVVTEATKVQKPPFFVRAGREAFDALYKAVGSAQKQTPGSTRVLVASPKGTVTFQPVSGNECFGHEVTWIEGNLRVRMPMASGGGLPRTEPLRACEQGETKLVVESGDGRRVYRMTPGIEFFNEKKSENPHLDRGPEFRVNLPVDDSLTHVKIHDASSVARGIGCSPPYTEHLRDAEKSRVDANAKAAEERRLQKQVDEHMRIATHEIGRAYPGHPFSRMVDRISQVDEDKLDRTAARNLFAHHVTNHHTPDKDGIHRIQKIREAARVFIYVLLQNTKEGHDRKAAIYAAREAMMWANASIAVKHTPVPD